MKGSSSTTRIFIFHHQILDEMKQSKARTKNSPVCKSLLSLFMISMPFQAPATTCSNCGGVSLQTILQYRVRPQGCRAQEGALFPQSFLKSSGLI
jgi:hypothetical protein